MAGGSKTAWTATERSLDELDAWLRVEHWQYVRLGERLAVLRLMARLGAERRPPTGAELLVEHGQITATYPARGDEVDRPRRPRLLGGEVLWRAYFALPLDIVEYPYARFELTAPGRAAIALPAPDLRVLSAQDLARHRDNPLPPRPVRRRLVVVAATTLAITGFTPALAAAATAVGHHPGARAARSDRGQGAASVQGLDSLSTAAPPPIASGGATVGTPSATVPVPGSLKVAGSQRRHRAPAAHAGHSRTGRLYTLTPAKSPTPTPHHSEKHPSASPNSSATGGAAMPAPRPRPTARPAVHPPHRAGEDEPAQAPLAVRSAPTSGTAGGSLAPVNATAWAKLSKLLTVGDRPPAVLIPIYKAAGHRYRVPWAVLAAINSIETDYGRNMSTSSAGAIGWMQFMPSTWAAYGVAAGRHSVPDPYDPHDAIFAAARYLAANGAARHLRKAIFAYNHATWYVDEVLWKAAGIADHTAVRGSRARGKLDAMRAMALAVDGEPYIWGGGHSNWEIQPGYDCSGFVSTVLHAAGYLEVPVTTQTLPSQPGILTGPGRYVTIFDRTNGGAADADHVIIDINGQWWESGGSSGAGGAASVHRIAAVSAAYLLSFNEILHPRGL
jgi:soluble lytic murein transglycosylase-like protein